MSDVEVKDWKGDRIAVGARVLYTGSESWARWIGTVTDVVVDPDYSWRASARADIEFEDRTPMRKRSLFVTIHRLTVLNLAPVTL